MLLRSTSTRRTRASRNAGGTPQAHVVGNSQPMPRGRRASVATDKGLPLGATTIDGFMDRQRSPRGSMVPNIALDNDDFTPDEPVGRRLLPDPELCTSSRVGLMPGPNRSPRNSLVPDEYCRSPRGSLVPPDSGYNRSPRNSLVPGNLGHSRNSLNPVENGSNRNSTHSLLAEGSRSPRGSMANIEFDRSPRGSICPSDVSRSPRGSIVPIDQERISRGSICQDVSRSPRGSIGPIDMDRTSRGSIILEYHNQSPRGSIMPESINRSPRGSIAPDSNRSPRGSICPEGNRSPRGSIATHEINRSPRGSVGQPADFDRTPRGSLGGQTEPEQPPKNRSPRGSIGPEIDRSPRGSLGGHEKRNQRALTPQDPRRASADQGTTTNRNTSPYRQRESTSGTGRSNGNYGPQTNLGYGTNAWADSRRASSSVSQFSGDESRRLCGGVVNSMEKGSSGSGPLGVATYGTLVFQLKDAHREASGTCDFVFRAMRVVSKTMVVTICLGCLSTIPIVMLIMGLQFSKDCPQEPNIPLYMIVGGSLASFRMSWALYSQIRSRRLETLSVPSTRSHISPMKLVSIALTFFLSIWFVLGNYWILSIRWPEYAPREFDPDHYCDKRLYIFSLIHLGIVYAVIAASIITAIALAICRFFACPWFERYK